MSQHTVKCDNTNAVNGIDMEILLATVQAISDEPGLGECQFRAHNTWIGGSKNATTIGNFYGAGQENEHQQEYVFQADEPTVLAGHDDAANPVEYLLHALAACVTTSMVAHAAVKGIHIEELECKLEGDIDLNGFLGLDSDVPKGFTDIRVKFKVKTESENLEKLRQLATFSPVYNTLIHSPNVDIQVDCE